MEKGRCAATSHALEGGGGDGLEHKLVHQEAVFVFDETVRQTLLWIGCGYVSALASRRTSVMYASGGASSVIVPYGCSSVAAAIAATPSVTRFVVGGRHRSTLLAGGATCRNEGDRHAARASSWMERCRAYMALQG